MSFFIQKFTHMKESDLKWFDGCKTPESASEKLKKVSKQYHPDVEDGNNDAMASINLEYSLLKLKFKKQEESRIKNKELFDWVREKGLRGIEDNHEKIKKATQEGVKRFLENTIPDDKKTIRKIAIGLIVDEIENFDLNEFGRNIFEQVGKILKLEK